MRPLLTIAVAVAVAGCSGGSGTSATTQTPAAVPSQRVAASLSSRTIGRLGAVLVDDGGRTLYANDGPCDLTCLRTWPLILAPVPAATGAVQTGLLSTVPYDGFSAVAYDGHALHAYVGDAGPGGAAGQGVQGAWAAVTVAGTSAVGLP